ncbi:PAS domain S-box protein [bacterium]|nr:PAS domain S-box protein [bacterium]
MKLQTVGLPNQIPGKVLFLILLMVIPLGFFSYADVESTVFDQFIPQLRQNLYLTTEEQLWIKNHPVIRIAGPKSFPPFYFHNENGIEQGIGADYYRLIFRSLGVETETQRNLPWTEVLSGIKDKRIDVIAFSAKTEEREQYLDFTRPYLSFPLIIVSRTDAAYIGGLNDLIDKRIACVRKNAACEWIKRDFGALNFIWVNTPLEAMEYVAFDKADVHIENLAAATYQIQYKGFNNLKIAAPTSYGNYNIHFAVRKDWNELVTILNKALSAVPAEADIAIRSKWLSQNLDQEFQQTLIKWILIISGVALVIILIILRWNRRLRNEIAERKKLTAALSESEAVFSAVFQNSPAAITISSIKSGKYININDAVTTFTGFLHSEMINGTANDLNIWENPADRQQLVEKISDGETVRNKEFSFIDRNGKRKFGLISGTRIKVGNDPCVMLVTMDITDLKQTEKRLEETKERYTSLFERSLDPVIIYDLQGQLIDANLIGLELLGVTKEELSSINLFELMDQEQQKMLIQSNEEIVQYGGQKELREYKLRHKDGSNYWLEATGTAIYEDGKLIAIQGLGRNITDRKKAEQEQKRLISKLLDALDNIKNLKGMLPICANCKKIRDDKGYWNQIESYIEEHSEALFSHGICPDCAEQLYGHEPWFGKKK